MINFKKIFLDFGGQAIFEDLNITLDTSKKIGLVGNNGTGKTTLLRMLKKENEQYFGTIDIPKNISIAYLPQHATLLSTKTVLEEALFSEEEDLLLQPKEHEVKIILDGLGFQDKLNKPVNELSTGWQMRLLLAKLLIKKADFYLFDEPTNHLDITTKEWLLNKLKTLPGFILISHERYFLDNLPDQIIELNQKKAITYHGNFTYFENQKAINEELLLKNYLEQQKEIDEKLKTISRFKATASKAKMAQSMLKKVEKIELIEAPVNNNRRVNFSFPSLSKSGTIVLKVENLSHSYNSQKILDSVSFEIEKNEKIAIVAPNGIGKTTLLKLIVGKMPIQQGKIIPGHNVLMSYFEQDNVVVLPENKAIIDYMISETKVSEEQIRTFLGGFLFCKDTIYKKIGVLSGGEKNRLCMTKTLLKNGNFLILDEPTNHLDITSKEILSQALKQYPGTILFVSHDQYFINSLATRILKLSDQKIESYPGNYDDYLYLQKDPVQKVEDKPNQLKVEQKEAAKKFYELERNIKKAEDKLKNLELTLTEYDYGNPMFAQVSKKIVNQKKEIEELLKLWENKIN
jgi:ATP-binding cassette subfamily F protein 3